jgi:hypothetical protein
MNWSLDLGMMTNHRLPESTRQSPELSESTEQSLELSESTEHNSSLSPKSLFSTLTGNRGTSIPGDNMDKKVLLCYPNPDQIIVGLRSSTQKYPNHSTLRGYQAIINQLLVIL